MKNQIKRNTVKAANGAQRAKADVLAITIKEVRGQIAGIRQRLLAVGLSTLSADQRQHSSGKFREGESQAIQAILDAMDARPGIFASLAARDHGEDEAKLETKPWREALARRDTVAPLLEDLESLGQLISDDVLAWGERVKDVSVPAYGIIKANANIDPVVQSTAAKALDFYGAPARARAAKKRRSQKTTPAA